MGYNYHRENYTTDTPYIVNHVIREYDISKANISILHAKGVLSDDEYTALKSVERMQRQIYIGKMFQQDSERSKLYSEALAEYRKKFIEENHIPDMNIVSVHKDSFFIMDQVPEITNFGSSVEFKKKNEYIVYMRIAKLQLFYNIDRVTDIETLDIKGISDERLNLHMEMIGLICEVIFNLLTQGVEFAIATLKSVYNDYISRKLPLNYYREFNAESVYRVHVPTTNSSYTMDFCEESYLDVLDIGYNDMILRELMGTLSSIYFNR